MGKVLYPFTDMPAETVLEYAAKEELSDCMVLGYKGGELYIVATSDDIPKMMWLLERAKHRLLDLAGEEGLI